jgi:diamine N-acetyltransferase
VVSLRPLGESDREAVDALRVAPGQERFVSSVVESLREAAEHPDAHAQCWVVHAEDTPVGFVMIADEVDGSPIGFYERYGFERTGEVVDGEVALQLRLT